MNQFLSIHNVIKLYTFPVVYSMRHAQPQRKGGVKRKVFSNIDKAVVSCMHESLFARIKQIVETPEPVKISSAEEVK